MHIIKECFITKHGINEYEHFEPLQYFSSSIKMCSNSCENILHSAKMNSLFTCLHTMKSNHELDQKIYFTYVEEIQAYICRM